MFLDRDATIAKARELIAEAGRSGARLVVFPEAFIPTYPDWIWRIPPGQHQRNVVERCVNRLKQWRGIATRYDKRAANYRAMVVIASLMIWLAP